MFVMSKSGQLYSFWGLHGTKVASQQAPPGSIPSVPDFFRRKIINVAEVNQRRWSEESGQWL